LNPKLEVMVKDQTPCDEKFQSRIRPLDEKFQSGLGPLGL